MSRWEGLAELLAELVVEGREEVVPTRARAGLIAGAEVDGDGLGLELEDVAQPEGDGGVEVGAVAEPSPADLAVDEHAPVVVGPAEHGEVRRDEQALGAGAGRAVLAGAQLDGAGLELEEGTHAQAGLDDVGAVVADGL
ncbi:hypothetical protein [Plesiocystis pacifica]|uniref:hypothetical protein n=1 Tax=Plesiocystis pacifica TaxID=191768 RepID=UPI0005D472E3|nr:hypothetical protein [Plesiocystis pacifica]